MAPEHVAYVRTLGRFGGWLACRLLRVKRQPVYAAVCRCGWVGPARLSEWDAEADGAAHEVVGGC